MNKDIERWQALFRFGIIFFNTHRNIDALTVFEYLVSVHPEVRIYKEYEIRIRKILQDNEDSQVLGGRLHLTNATDFTKRLRIANAVASFGDPNLIDLCFFEFDVDERPEHLLAKANSTLNADIESWLNYANQYLAHFNLSPISIAPVFNERKTSLFFRLASAELPKVTGPLITVCMTCYNGAKYIETAVNSILNQTYENFELFIVDDLSDDNSLDVIRKIASCDSRIRVIENSIGKGTYASRNQVLSLAKGEFFAVHDSDDFALPERLAIQINWLLKHPKKVALLAEWIRISIEGNFEFKTGWEGAYQHQAHATLVLRTNEIKNRLGYWDSVFFGADTEMIFRIRKVYGDEGAGMLKMPMTLALSHAESLTQHPLIGINKGVNKRSSDVRIEYRKSWEAWHDSFNSDSDAYIAFPQTTRPFVVPEMILSAPRNINVSNG